jgi:hypothetical protein
MFIEQLQPSNKFGYSELATQISSPTWVKPLLVIFKFLKDLNFLLRLYIYNVHKLKK